MDWRPEQEQYVIEFVHRTRLEDFPQSVVHQGRRCFLDLLGCSFAGIPARTSEIARRFALSFGGTEQASLYGSTRRAPLVLSVFANATVCEALDADDGYNLVKGHPGAFLLPAVLALAEQRPMSGEGALTALLVGYEIAMRAGRIVRIVCPTYHGSGSWGGLGVAAVAARALGLAAGETAHALGAAEYHGTMAPIMRCVSLPGMVKDGVAWSAFGGVSAALLAQQGFTSTPSLFGVPEAADLVNSLGREFLIEQLYFKPYCTCRWAQAPVRGALKVCRDYGISPERIRRIRIETFAEACALTRKFPQTSEEAQYSVAYPIAVALLEGDCGPAQVLERALPNERARGLMERMEFVVRPDFQARFPARRFAEIIVETVEGEFTSGPVTAPGDADDPLPDHDLEDKFRRYAAPYLDAAQANALISTVAHIETLSDAAFLLPLLARDFELQ
ncbi:MAG: MmgE/PrpD family protein [Bryobacteraceae bacterium]